MVSFNDVLIAAKEYCKNQMVDATYRLYIEKLQLVSFEDSSIITLSIENEFLCGIVNDRYLNLLRDAFKSVLGFEAEVRVISPEEPAAPPVALPAEELSASSQSSSVKLPSGRYDFTFENFIKGPSNQFTLAAAQAVANNPAYAYNPLFIWGSSGLGKTHLLNAIQIEIKKNHPDFNIMYITCEQFTNELIAAIRSNSTEMFRQRYRQADLLLVDDIQFIAGKESTQEEFFHTFNHLHTSGKQIIISSDKPPKDIETLEARLRTRFEWGLIADISSPNYETRMAILQKKIELDHLEKYNIPNDVLEYIATNVKTNIRELEGSLNKLIALYKLNNTGSIDIALAAEALKDIISSDNRREVTPELILDIVSEHFGVSIPDLKGNKRNAEIVFPRQIAMYLIRNMTETSLKAVGVILGGKDHSTIKHGIEKIENELKADETLSNTINIIKKKINPA